MVDDEPSEPESPKEHKTADWFRETWKELEKSLDEHIAKALSRVKIPKREEVEALCLKDVLNALLYQLC